jgi:hypothetical protein
MKLCASYAASSETNHSYSFDLPPTSGAVLFSQPSEVTNSRTDGDGFDVRDITDNLERFHAISQFTFRLDIREGYLYTLSQLKNGIAGKPASNPSA